MAVTGNYHHVHLISPVPRETAEWYVKFLSGEIFKDEELRGARNVRVKLGECLLNIRGERPGESFSDPGGERPYGIAHFCLAVDDIEGMLAHVDSKGGVISEPLFSLPSGNRPRSSLGSAARRGSVPIRTSCCPSSRSAECGAWRCCARRSSRTVWRHSRRLT